VAAHKIIICHGRLREKVPVTIQKDQVGTISEVDLAKLEVQVVVQVRVRETEKAVTTSVPQNILEVQKAHPASPKDAGSSSSATKLVASKGLDFLNSDGGKTLEVTPV